MREVFFSVLSLSLSGTLAALLLLALRPLYTRWLSKGWRYYIWLVVLCRLTLPIALPALNLTDAVLSAMQPTQATEALQDTPPVQGMDIRQLDLGAAPEPGQSALPSAAMQRQEPVAPHRLAALAAEVWDMAWMVWLGVAMMQLVRLVTRYHSFARFIRAGWRAAEDPALLDALDEACRTVRIRRCPAVYINPLASSPMLVGILRPVIVLPTDGLAPETARHILLHELVHLRRRDIVYKWAAQAVCCLHWFNPMAYWVRREINRACELACDEKVLSHIDQGEAYGNTLLATADMRGRYGEPVASVTMSEEGKIMKERLQAIVRRHRWSAGNALFAGFLAVAVLCGAVCTGVYTGYAEPAVPTKAAVDASPHPTVLPVATVTPAAAVTPVPTARPETGAEWGANIGEKIGGWVDQGLEAWQDGMDQMSDWWTDFEAEMEQFAQDWEDYDWDAWLEEHVGEAGVGSSFQSGGRLVTNNAYYVQGYLVGLRYDSAFTPGEDALVLEAEDAVIEYPQRYADMLTETQAQQAVQEATARMRRDIRMSVPMEAFQLTRLEGPFAEVTEAMLSRYFDESDVGALLAMTPYAPEAARIHVFERACTEGEVAAVAVMKDALPSSYDFDSAVLRAHDAGETAVKYLLLDEASSEVREQVTKHF